MASSEHPTSSHRELSLEPLVEKRGPALEGVKSVIDEECESIMKEEQSAYAKSLEEIMNSMTIPLVTEYLDNSMSEMFDS
jgi:hypothetical protein